MSERNVEKLLEAQQALMNVYSERSELVALLSRLWPSHLAIDDEVGTAYTVVCVHTPNGQAAWHINWKNERHLFPHLDEKEAHNDWDGHSTEQKYDRLRNLPLVAASPEVACPHKNTKWRIDMKTGTCQDCGRPLGESA